MRISTKPISSPGRTEKFPPPLMSFLRSNVGSKSRGRYRSSPMFMRKKNTAIEPTQEPSSPKVTCIGQVRVQRNFKQNPGGRNGKNKGPPARGPCSCGWVKKALSCSNFAEKIRPRSFHPVWRKWAWFSPFEYCRRGDVREDLSTVEAPEEQEDEKEEEEEEEGDKVPLKEEPQALNWSSPPKNALLLTRCRSAPYRSSSVANRFWGSPLTNSETGEGNTDNKLLQGTETKDRETEKLTAASEPSSRNSTAGCRIDIGSEGNSLRIAAELEERSSEEAKETGEEKEEEETVQPLILTRSKSEPARTVEKLNPEASLRRPRRLGFAGRCSPRACELIK